MITSEFVREDSGTRSKPLTKNYASAREAWVDMVRFELGYGGKIIGISKHHVTTLTHTCGVMDTTTFRGTPEEIQVLQETAVIMLGLRADTDRVPDALEQAALDLFAGRSSPFPKNTKQFVQDNMGLITSRPRLRPLLYVLLEASQDVIEILDDVNMKDLFSMTEMKLFDDADLEELLALIDHQATVPA